VNVASTQTCRRVLGRYALFDEIAAGGMATVHIGRLLGPAGFARTVAIKCLHPHFAKDPEFVSMFVDEARLAARISHPNVVATLDIVAEGGELFLVMEYVAGDSLAHLLRAAPDGRVPPPLAIGIVMGALHGLHAAHEAMSERAQPLSIVHRDVSPQNIQVGTDGVARVLDFGIAKAASRLQTTQEGQLKGKLGYMAPEQLDGEVLDRRTDVYAAGVVLWESLTGKRLFSGKDGAPILNSAQRADVGAVSAAANGIPGSLDAIVTKALAFHREDRFATAKEMAIALEETGLVASQREVGEWVERTAHVALAVRATIVAELDSLQDVVPSGLDSGRSHIKKDSHSASRENEPTVNYGMSVTEASGVIQRTVASRPRGRATLVIACTTAVALLLFAWGFSAHRAGLQAQAPIVVHAVPTSGEPPPPAPIVFATATALAASPSSLPSATVIATAPRSLPLSPRVSKGSRVLSAPRVLSCIPPYTIDDDGVRVPKRHCL
jgi:eukaryotic-like serine/threonine-protein kinase